MNLNEKNEFYQCFSDSVNSFVQESILEPRVGLEAKDVSEELSIRLMSYQAQEVIRNPRGPPSTGNGEMKGPLQSQRPEKDLNKPCRMPIVGWRYLVLLIRLISMSLIYVIPFSFRMLELQERLRISKRQHRQREMKKEKRKRW
jgi:hypothetical protein